jgi:hypothetical protein
MIKARQVQLICGARCLSWNVLDDMWDCGTFRWANLMSRKIIHQRLLDALQAPLTPLAQGKVLRSGDVRSRVTLDSLLAVHAGKNCFDPRDRIYALLNVAQFSRPGIQPTPDYRKSPLEVRTEATIAILLGHERLDHLLHTREYYREFELRQTRFLEKPSWEPFSWKPCEGLPLRTDIPNRIYCSAGSTLIGNNIWNSNKPWVLRLQGIAIDKIATVTQRLERDYDRSWEEVVRDWEPRELDSGGLIPSTQRQNEIRLRAYCRTLLQDFKNLGSDHPDFRGKRLDEKDLDDAFDSFLVWTGRRAGQETLCSSSIDREGRNQTFIDWIENRLDGYCFFRTQSGLFGLTRAFAAVGDVVSVLYGASMPVLLRPVIFKVNMVPLLDQKMSTDKPGTTFGAIMCEIMGNEKFEDIFSDNLGADMSALPPGLVGSGEQDSSNLFDSLDSEKMLNGELIGNEDSNSTLLDGPETSASVLPSKVKVNEESETVVLNDSLPRDFRYTLIGAAYVDRIMDGEVVEQVAQGVLEEHTFFIV